MLVAAVAGVDDTALDVIGEQPGGTGIGVADHQHVGVHGVQRHRGVDERLALLDRRARHRDVDDVGAEPLARELERGAGAGRGLEEEQHDGAPAEQALALLHLAVQRDIALGDIKQVGDCAGGKPLDPQQMPVAEDRGQKRGLHRYTL